MPKETENDLQRLADTRRQVNLHRTTADRLERQERRLIFKLLAGKRDAQGQLVPGSKVSGSVIARWMKLSTPRIYQLNDQEKKDRAKRERAGVGQ